MKRKELVTRYRIAENKKFRLEDIDSADTWSSSPRSTRRNGWSKVSPG